MPRWAMVIDLRKCIGCETCRQVCTEMNKTPGGGEWRRVIDPGLAVPTQVRMFLPISCMHCEKPPCLKACPTGATRKKAHGIVDIESGKCLGCGACVVACPYGARYIANQDLTQTARKAIRSASKSQQKDRIGVSSKCNFCRSIVESGYANGMQPGVDPEASPHCVRYCLGEALRFGDLDDADSEVSRQIRENKVIQLQEELGTQPAVFYIVDS